MMHLRRKMIQQQLAFRSFMHFYRCSRWYSCFLFNELVITSIKMNVVTAMMMGVCLTIILEVIRKPKHAFESVKIIDVFFGGMGKQFANIITLIMSGEIFAEGLKRMGMIDLIIEGAQNIGFGPIPMTIVMVAIIMISAIIMGSGAAPFYAIYRSGTDCF